MWWEMRTHNYGRSCEQNITAIMQTETHRTCVMKQSDVEPDDIKHGDIPVLKHE